MHWRRRRPDGTAAARAVAEQRAKLRRQAGKLGQARRDYPEVQQASDRLAEWIDDALGGRGKRA